MNESTARKTSKVYASPPPSVTGWLADLLHLIVPANCLACNERVDRVRDGLGLCLPCRSRLQTWPERSCACCRRPLEAAALPSGYLCGPCRRQPPAFDELLCAWSYDEPLTHVITGLKFRQLEYLGSQVGRHLALEFAESISTCDLITEVPLHWTRRLRRGYDQGRAIARAVAKQSGVPRVAALRRLRATPPQSRLSRPERKKNLAGAFRCRSKRIRGKSLLLVDDVVTTGATLDAAAAALKAAGAKRVTALLAAKTPIDPEPRAQKR